MSSPSPSFMGPRAADRPKVPRTRAATWSHRETLDFLALWGEEAIQAQLNRCHRNADVYQWISERMAEKGYFRDEDQCRTKGKDLKKSYKQAKMQDGVARQRCRFFHELDAILAGAGRGGAPWCQVVIKEESDPELEPDQELPEEDEYAAWTQASVVDGSALDPHGEPAATASSSSSSQVPEGLIPPEPSILHHPVASGLIKEEEKSPPREGADVHAGGRAAGGPYLYPQEDSPVETLDREVGRSGVAEEPLLHRGTRAHLEPPWRTGLSKRAFSRPRNLLSTREKLAQLRNRRKRPRDNRFDELVRDIRMHFREREKLFQSLWEEEKAQREKDRQLWTAEMDWVRQMWAKSQKESMGEDQEMNRPGRVKEEKWNKDLCKDLERGPCKENSVQEGQLLKVSCAFRAVSLILPAFLSLNLSS